MSGRQDKGTRRLYPTFCAPSPETNNNNNNNKGPHRSSGSQSSVAFLLSEMVDPMYSGVDVVGPHGGGAYCVEQGALPRRPVSARPLHDDTNEFISSVMLCDSSATVNGQNISQALVRVSMLAAGFLCGVGGRNINSIQKRMGVRITSSRSTEGTVRIFKVSAVSGSHVKSAVAVMQEAVGFYKSLTEGDFIGQYVEPEVTIQGITFQYAPPPKDKMPRAASVKKLPQSMTVLKEAEQSFMSTLESHSSVDSNENLSFGSAIDAHHSGASYYSHNPWSSRNDRTPARRLEKDFSRARGRGPGQTSPFTPAIGGDRGTFGTNSSPLPRSTYSSSSLQDMKSMSDRSDRDWRGRDAGACEGRGHGQGQHQASRRARNLLKEFQGIHF